MTAPDLFIRKTASISECGLYRYLLGRAWGDGPLLPFIMLNPSTADADIDDPTIRRCMGFAKREGTSGVSVANLFALRSKDPSALLTVSGRVGPGNEFALEMLTRAAIEGELGRLRDRLRKVETESRAVVSEWKHGFDNRRLTSALRDLEAELTEAV